jgi:LysM domain
MALKKEWTDTMLAAAKDKRSADYDKLIQGEIGTYNKMHNLSVDWTLFKAMVWVESGGPSSKAWAQRAMQIGNPGDAGYAAIKKPRDRDKIVATPAILQDVQKGSIDDPSLNIRAGIAFTFVRMADTAFQSVLSSDKKVYDYTVAKGDSFSKIADKQGTTVDVLKGLNAGKETSLRPGDVLHYLKASMQWTVTGWKTFDEKTVAAAYNGGGDPQYAEKLVFVEKLL